MYYLAEFNIIHQPEKSCYHTAMGIIPQYNHHHSSDVTMWGHLYSPGVHIQDRTCWFYNYNTIHITITIGIQIYKLKYIYIYIYPFFNPQYLPVIDAYLPPKNSTIFFRAAPIRMTIFLVVASIGCGKNPEFMACFWGKWWKHMKTPEFCFWKTVIYDDLWILDDCSHVLFFENPCKNWHDLRLLHLFSDCRHKLRHLQHVIRSLLYGERQKKTYGTPDTSWYVLMMTMTLMMTWYWWFLMLKVTDMNATSHGTKLNISFHSCQLDCWGKC